MTLLDPITIPSPFDGSYMLTWSGPGPQYELQMGADPAFLVHERRILEETSLQITSSEAVWYRVRSLDASGKPGPWSRTRRFRPEPTPLWRRRSEPDLETAQAVHRAMMRLAAARTDLFAVLACPRDLDEAQVGAYLDTLVNGPVEAEVAPVNIPLLSYSERPVLDYAALYHPWPALGLHDGGSELVPPDGPMCGVMAALALTKGAWFAPANQVLQDVVSLSRHFDGPTALGLFRKRLNLLRREPHGFCAIAADTLADGFQVGNINVRRLLILIRRLVDQEGDLMVFQPNNEAFQRAVKRRFEKIFTALYRRGAFKGQLPEQAFRVDVDKTLNDRRAADAGRFYLTLRFAPALPLHFLTVRLVQSADRNTVVEVL